MTCVSTIPENPSLISSKITINLDTFKNQTWIETPLYLSRQGFTDRFPVQIKFRALYKNDELSFIQLYVTSTNLDWGFFHSANGEDGMKLDFVKIDGVVSSNAGVVLTEEHFGLSIPKDYLTKMMEKDWQIKVYGKRNEGVFVVPSSLSKAFYDKMTCYELKNCM